MFRSRNDTSAIEAVVMGPIPLSPSVAQSRITLTKNFHERERERCGEIEGKDEERERERDRYM